LDFVTFQFCNIGYTQPYTLQYSLTIRINMRRPFFLALSLLLIAALFAPFSIRPVAAQSSGVCAAGLVPGTNLVRNGDFAIGAGPGPGIAAAAAFTSGIPNSGDGVYPPDTTLSIQTGAVNYAGGIVVESPFPGDAAFGLPAVNTWLYSNGNTTIPLAPYLTWEQTVSPVTPNTQYTFYAYINNVIVNTFNADDPLIQFNINGVNVGAATAVPELPDQWVRVQIPYTTGPAETSAVLRLFDSQTSSFGDDFGMTMVGFAPCVTPPAAPPPAVAPEQRNNTATISKTVSPTNAVPGDIVTWSIFVQNPNPTEVVNIQVDDLLPAEVAVLSTTQSSGSVTINGQNVQLVGGIIPGGGTLTLTVTTQVRTGTPSGVLTNFAYLNGDRSRSAVASVAVPSSGAIPAAVVSLPQTGQSPLSAWRMPLLSAAVVSFVFAAGLFIRRRKTSEQ
jgi:uncharacterized repeat protein (TIGR01451 family)